MSTRTALKLLPLAALVATATGCNIIGPLGVLFAPPQIQKAEVTLTKGRLALLVDEPDSTGDQRWDVFLAALAEHPAVRDGRQPPAWAEGRSLR